jgi:hypothetical protein
MMVARSFDVSPKKPLVAVRISSSEYLSVGVLLRRERCGGG